MVVVFLASVSFVVVVAGLVVAFEDVGRSVPGALVAVVDVVVEPTFFLKLQLAYDL